MDARKLIIIPEYRPLYALKAAFGPTHGPLTKPCPTPVDIIGKLLLQTGNEAVTIFEVKPDPNNSKVMMDPVQLTRENYELPYEEIAAITEKEPDVTLQDATVETTVVEPTYVEVSRTKVVENPAPEQDKTDNTPVTETIIVTPDVVDPVKVNVENIETSDEQTEHTAGYVANADHDTTKDIAGATITTTEEVNPYAGMTKAERRRARREAEAAAAAANKTEG